jgi:hypothetical protein
VEQIENLEIKAQKRFKDIEDKKKDFKKNLEDTLTIDTD